MEKQWHTAS
jgi:hypothetical protein